MPKKTWGTGTRTIRSARLFHHQKKQYNYGDLKENQDGKFLKITEACRGKRDTIVIPYELGDAFIHMIQKVKGGDIDGHLQGNRSSSKRSSSWR
jgi:hypothetical protein